MPIWIFLRGHFETTPAPSHAPTTDAVTINVSVVTSTSTTAIKINASRIPGMGCGTLD